MVGAKRLSVRLRPELRPTESLQVLEDVSSAIDDGALDGNPRPSAGCSCCSAQPPQSLLRAIYATLTDKYYGLASLGLASLRERGTLRSRAARRAARHRRRGLDGRGEARPGPAVARAVGHAARGIWFPSMTDGDWWKTKGGVKPQSGKFKPIKWLPPGAARKTFDAAVAARPADHILRARGRHVTGCSAARSRWRPAACGATASAAGTPSGPSPGSTGASTAAPARSAPWTRRPTRCSGRARATTGPAPSAPWPTRPSRR